MIKTTLCGTPRIKTSLECCDIIRLKLKSEIMKTKVCIGCGPQPLSEFYDRRSKCKKCINARSRRYRENNPHRIWAEATIRHHEKKGLTTNITSDELTEIAKNSLKCLLCDVELIWSYGDKNGRVVDNSPALDIIDPANKTINKNNIQIICHPCNGGKASGTNEEYIIRCGRVTNKLCKKN